MGIREELIKNIDKIIKALEEGKDVVIKPNREGITLQALKVKKLFREYLKWIQE